jgi:hypothetical protein
MSYAASPCYSDRADIKMESQVIFDSCWRRFMEKHQVVRVWKGMQLICWVSSHLLRHQPQQPHCRS